MVKPVVAPAPLPLVEDFRALFAQGDGDVTIRFCDGEFQAHSAVLGARSPVLQAMFKTPMKEAETNSMEMRCCRSTGLQFLLFVYTGELSSDWPSSTREVCEMGTLIDFYGVKGIDTALSEQRCQSLISKVEAEIPPESETFWVDLIGCLKRSGFPAVMREHLVNYFVETNLEWGRDLFLALCIADSYGADDVQEKCMEAVRSAFSTWTPTQPCQVASSFGVAQTGGSLFGQPATPGQGGGLLSEIHFGGGLFGQPAPSPAQQDTSTAKTTGLEAELAEARLAQCIMHTSPTNVLRTFVRFQAEVLTVMEKKKQPSDPKFNTFLSEVHRGLIEASATIVQLTHSPEEQRDSQEKAL